MDILNFAPAYCMSFKRYLSYFQWFNQKRAYYKLFYLSKLLKYFRLKKKDFFFSGDNSLILYLLVH